jgi:hypothetical protein
MHNRVVYNIVVDKDGDPSASIGVIYFVIGNYPLLTIIVLFLMLSF